MIDPEDIALKVDNETERYNESNTEGRADVGIHPLVLMNLCDHWSRTNFDLKSQQTPKKIMGGLFGIQKGRDIEIVDSFELPSASELSESDSNMTLKAFLNQRTEQFATVFPGFEFLGWYAVQDKVQACDLTNHRMFMEFNESPLFLMLDPTPPPATKDNSNVKLPISLYESELHVVNGSPTMLFVKTSFKVHTTESEGIALDHISKVAPTNSSTQSSLHGSLGSVRDAIHMLDKQLGVLRRFLEATKNGEIPVDHQLLRQVASSCQQLPAIKSELFNGSFTRAYNETLLVTYLATITKGIACTNAVMEKFNVVNDRHHERLFHVTRPLI